VARADSTLKAFLPIAVRARVAACTEAFLNSGRLHAAF
jgi:hypothetical protein